MSESIYFWADIGPEFDPEFPANPNENCFTRCVEAERYDALQLAAWDVYEMLTDMLDNGEAAWSKSTQKVLDELGELLPAQRPT